MKLFRKRKALTISVLAVGVIFVILWDTSYHTSQFSGGLAIQDFGLFSYPRYRAVVGRLPLSKAGEYNFNVRGLPPGPLDFTLQLDDFMETDRPLIASLSTSIAVSIRDDSGKVVCSAAGSVSDLTKGSREGIWVLRGGVAPLPSPLRTELWNTGCLNLAIDRSRTYDVAITVTDADQPFPTRIMLVPTFSGGGIELP